METMLFFCLNKKFIFNYQLMYLLVYIYTIYNKNKIQYNIHKNSHLSKKKLEEDTFKEKGTQFINFFNIN